MWIQTRDGSPTLWHNQLAESYRSVKGAFTESFKIFAQAAFVRARERGWTHVQVGEFGLGAGTNWLLWSLLAQAHKLEFKYWAIEKDLEAFEMGRAEWPKCAELLCQMFQRFPSLFPSDYLSALSPEILTQRIVKLPVPKVYPSIEEAVDAQAPLAQLWFHDPFGYEVNPEGYQAETLKKLYALWAPQFFAFTYACNTGFQKTLGELPGVTAERRASGEHGLKRESLEFFRI